jgi:ABC-type proline/glycine betaine transport system substrate-binding protein
MKIDYSCCANEGDVQFASERIADLERNLKNARSLLTEALGYTAHANTCAVNAAANAMAMGYDASCDCDLDDFIGRALRAAE